MLTIERHINPDHRLAVGLALTFAAEALPILKEDPFYFQSRQILINVMNWLHGEATAAECTNSAFLIKEKYYEHASKLGYAIRAITNTAFATAMEPEVFSYATFVSESTAYALAQETNKFVHEFVHDRLIQLLPLILEYKIENQQNFNHPEEVFEYLSEKDKDKFLFNLDILI